MKRLEHEIENMFEVIFVRTGFVRMLRNTFYTGVLTYQQTAIFGNHEAIVSKVQFGKVQKQLERRHK